MTDEIHWTEDDYETLPEYEGLESVSEIIQKALASEKKGEWKELDLQLKCEYGDYRAVIIGKRPETALEEINRLKRERLDAERLEKAERKNYERLQKKFG